MSTLLPLPLYTTYCLFPISCPLPKIALAVYVVALDGTNDTAPDFFMTTIRFSPLPFVHLKVNAFPSILSATALDAGTVGVTAPGASGVVKLYLAGAVLKYTGSFDPLNS